MPRRTFRCASRSQLARPVGRAAPPASQGRLHRAPVRVHGALDPEPLRLVRTAPLRTRPSRRRVTDSLRIRQLEHPCRSRAQWASSRTSTALEGSLRALFPSHAFAPPGAGEGTSRQPLQPTSCHVHSLEPPTPEPRARARLACLAASRTSRPRPRAVSDPQNVRGSAERPRGCARPRATTRLSAAPPGCDLPPSPPCRGRFAAAEPMPVSWTDGVSRMAESLMPFVAPPPPHPRSTRAREGDAENPFHGWRANATASQAQGTFRRRVPRLPLLTGVRGESEGRHWYPGRCDTPRPSFRHGFTHSGCCALGRPTPSGYSPRWAGPMPPADFCSRWEPRARQSFVQAPVSVGDGRTAAPHRVTAPLREPPVEFHRLGVARLSASFLRAGANAYPCRAAVAPRNAPPWRPLARVDLPQPIRPRHPLSRADAAALRNDSRATCDRAVGRSALLRSDPIPDCSGPTHPTPRARGAEHLVGPLNPHPPAKRSTGRCTRGAFHPRARSPF
jgi:hypothetical protein